MIFQKVKLEPGLYVVATPIGNARDITLRALDILASADVIAAEDTRSARRLMEIHGIPLAGRKLIAYHDHSSQPERQKILDFLEAGEAVALASEAGTPMVSDPGYALVNLAREAGAMVTAAPGASAALSALCVAGLPSDSFYFAGFLPPKTAARRTAMAELADYQATLIFYESPKRIESFLTDLAHTLGCERKTVICRELTKKFEEVISGTAAQLREQVSGVGLRGECVVLVAREEGARASNDDIEVALMQAMKTMRIKDAATLVAGSFGLPRRDVYQIALGLKE